MTASGHAIVGAAIVAKIPDLRISLPLVIISHVVGDAFEHWDTAINWRQKDLKRVFWDSFLDLVLSYFLVTIIFIWWLKLDPTKMLLAVFTSQLLDYAEVPYFFFGWHFPPWSWVNIFAHLFHKKIKLPINLTLINQVIISVLFILLAATA